METPEKKKIKILRFERKPEDIERSYDIEPGEELGKGIFSKVKRARISPEGIERGNAFAIKRPRIDFSEKDDASSLSEEDKDKLVQDVAMHLRRYKEFKGAGVKHLPTTYRPAGIENGIPVIVMTDYTQDGVKTVLSNNTDESGFEMVDVQNLEELFKDMTEDVKRLTMAGYWVPLDAYFFIVPSEGGSVEHMEFAIADYDKCRKSIDLDEREDLFKRNMEQASGALQHVLKNHLSDRSKKTNYIYEIRKWSDRMIAEHYKGPSA